MGGASLGTRLAKAERLRMGRASYTGYALNYNERQGDAMFNRDGIFGKKDDNMRK